MLRFLSLIITVSLSYFLFNILTDPSSKVHNKLPYIKLKWIQILPNLRIHVRGRIVFIHHWLGLSLILIVSIVYGGGFLDSPLTKGFLLGGIFHGFTYPDWKNIIAKKTDFLKSQN